MKATDIMKLGDILHELANTADSVLNTIRVLRGIPGKDHDDDVDALYRVYDEICAEMERLAGGIGDNVEPEKAKWYYPYYDDDNKPIKFVSCSNCHNTIPLIMATKYCPVCKRLMDFSELLFKEQNEQNEFKTEEKEDKESSN